MNPIVSVARQALGLGPLNITPKQKYLALLLAGVVDVAQATVLAPYTGLPGAASPVEWGVDIATTILLTAILGWNWRLLAAFAIELVPTAAMFPTWSALILTITTVAGTSDKPQLGEGAQPNPTPNLPPPGTSSLPTNAPTPTVTVNPEAAKFPGVYHRRSRLAGPRPRRTRAATSRYGASDEAPAFMPLPREQASTRGEAPDRSREAAIRRRLCPAERGRGCGQGNFCATAFSTRWGLLEPLARPS